MTTPGNMKLAQEPGTDPTTGKPKATTLIETRGEGGYALAPGSPPACHHTGRTWDHFAGPKLTELLDITTEAREVLISAAQSFDLATAAKAKRPESGTKTGTGAAGLRPGGDYDRRGPDWPEILEPHGWERAAEPRYNRLLAASRQGDSRFLLRDHWLRHGEKTAQTCSPSSLATPILSKGPAARSPARATESLLPTLC